MSLFCTFFVKEVEVGGCKKLYEITLWPSCKKKSHFLTDSRKKKEYSQKKSHLSTLSMKIPRWSISNKSSIMRLFLTSFTHCEKRAAKSLYTHLSFSISGPSYFVRLVSKMKRLLLPSISLSLLRRRLVYYHD